MNISGKLLFNKPRFVEKPYSWLQHVPFAFYMVETLKPKLIVELGTHSGNSYFSFCQAVDELKLKCKCYAIDTWAGDEQSGFYGSEVYERVKKINKEHFHGFSYLLKMTFDEGLPYFSDGSIDLLHIDGLHTYEAVKHDYESWLPKMSKKGVIIFHDTVERGKEFGVWKLFEEVSGQHPSLEFNHGHGLGVLCVGEKTNRQFLEFIHLANQETNIQHFFSTLGNRLLLFNEAEDLSNEKSFLNKDIRDAKQLLKGKENEITLLKNTVKHTEEKHNKLQKLLQAKNDELEKRRQDLEGLNRQLKGKDDELEKRRQDLEGLNRQLKGKDDELEKRRQDLEGLNRQLKGKDSIIKSITNSTSWRITKPIRFLGHRKSFIKQSLFLPFRIVRSLISLNFKEARKELVYLKDIYTIKNSGMFDAEWYLENNPDVRDSGVDPIVHYVRRGADEGRDPSPNFNTYFYLQNNEDVANSDINPLMHYVLYGEKEGRSSSTVEKYHIKLGGEKINAGAKKKRGLSDIFSDLADVDDDRFEQKLEFDSINEQEIFENVQYKQVAHTLYFNLVSLFKENRLLKRKSTNKRSVTKGAVFSLFKVWSRRKKIKHVSIDYHSLNSSLLKHFYVNNKPTYEAREFIVNGPPEKTIQYSHNNKFKGIQRFHNLSAEYKNIIENTLEKGLHLTTIGSQPFIEVPLTGIDKNCIAQIEIELLNYSGSHVALLYTVINDLEYNKEKAQIKKVKVGGGKDNKQKLSYKLGTTYLKGPLRLYFQNSSAPFFILSISINLFNQITPQKPFFSFIIPCYNHGMYVKETVDSILHINDGNNYEVIIIDDGSTDKQCVKLLNELAKDNRVDLIRQNNSGLGKARNVGIKNSRGKYILPVDADNRIRPVYYHNAIELLETDPEIGVVYSDVWFFGEKEFRQELEPHDRSHQFIQNQIDACAVFRREVWEQVGGYQETMIGYQDWEFWTAVDSLNYWRFYHLREIGFDYRKLPGSMVSHTKLFSQEIIDFISARHLRSLRKQHKKLFYKIDDFENNKTLTSETITSQIVLVNESQPLVSIIAPNYNKERYIKLRLDTILKQTYKNFELIILDNASTDNSVREIEKLTKNRENVSLYVNQENNNNVFKQWKKGIDLAKGEIIWIAETDDYSDVNFLSQLVPRLSDNLNINLAYCQSNFVDEKGNVFDNHIRVLSRLNKELWNNNFCIEGNHYLSEYMSLVNCIPNASAVIFKKELVDKIRWEDVFQFKVCGDWWIWSQFLEHTNLTFCAESLNYFRFDSHTQRKKEGGDLTRVMEHLKVLAYINKAGKLSEPLKNNAINNFKKKLKENVLSNDITHQQLYHFFKEVNSIWGSMSFSYQSISR